jgi:L-cysteate sulfo-lyase
VFHGRVPFPTESYLATGNALLNRLFGAVCHEVPWTGDRNAEIGKLRAGLEAKGMKPFTVPYGVSSVMGAVGYTSAAVEIAEQCSAEGFVPSAIVHCSGSGGTQAGLVVGASLALPDTQIVGIDIDAEPERVRADVIRYGDEAAKLLGISFDASKVEVVAGLAGPMYGVPHSETIDAIKLAGRTEALIVDPVYSGKGLAGLISLIRSGRWRQDEDVVFLHTGGEPAVFAYRERLEL